MATPAILSHRVTRILIVDDHPLMREGLGVRIAQQPDLEVCGEADSVTSALAQVRALHPDMVLVDIQLPDSNGIELIKELHSQFPRIRILVITAFDELLYAERALRAGAHGFVNKRELQGHVLEAIRAVAGGDRYLSAAMTQRMLSQAINGKKEDSADPVERLSDRELEVFQLIGQGYSTSAIADQLMLSVHTIDTHREKIRHKLGVKNGVELTVRAVQWMLEKGP